MNAEILAVGTELLMGQIANTNAQYISSRLADLGINVYYHSVVGDNPNRLKQSLNLSLERSDFVIMTGGLGPTKDDLTKETVANVVNRELVIHNESLKSIEDFFAKINRSMAENNKKQAYFPVDSIIMKNDKGTAPGCIIEKNNKVIFMLPGPPFEMKNMFEQSVVPYLQSKSNEKIMSKHLRIFGIGESSLEEKLIDLIDGQNNPTIAPYAKMGEVSLRVSAKCYSAEKAESLIEPVVTEIKNRIGDFLYSTENENLDEVAAKLLMNSNTSISIAESCTGGLIAAKLTSISGISKVFDRSIVTYSNEAKMQSLGVKSETLKKYGAVSEETAKEMAVGIKNLSKSNMGLSVTGIAGPDGGTDEKPVGLVYVALATENEVKCTELKLHGDRDRIRNMTCLNAFDMVRRKLMN